MQYEEKLPDHKEQFINITNKITVIVSELKRLTGVSILCVLNVFLNEMKSHLRGHIQWLRGPESKTKAAISDT